MSRGVSRGEQAVRFVHDCLDRKNRGYVVCYLCFLGGFSLFAWRACLLSFVFVISYSGGMSLGLII